MIQVLETVFYEVALEVAAENLSQKKLSAISKIALGTFQLLVGIPAFPFQLCGRIFRANKALFLGKGISTLKKARSIGRRMFGVLEILFGTLILPFQITGRIFHYKRPFLSNLGCKNIFQGFKGLGSSWRTLPLSAFSR